MARVMFPMAARAKEFGSSYIALPGSEINPMPLARIVGLPNPHRRIEITLLLRHPQNSATEAHTSLDELGTLLPHERRHLSREALAASQGANPADERAVARFARQFGLRVAGRHPGARTVHLIGTIAN